MIPGVTQIATTAATKALGSLLGRKKKPMVVYNKAHPAVNQAAYRRDRYYRMAVDELHRKHVNSFGVGWTSTSDGNAIASGISRRRAQLMRLTPAQLYSLRPDLWPAPAAPTVNPAVIAGQVQQAQMSQGQLYQLLAALLLRR